MDQRSCEAEPKLDCTATMPVFTAFSHHQECEYGSTSSWRSDIHQTNIGSIVTLLAVNRRLDHVSLCTT